MERRRLRSANALFEEVGMLRPRELDRKAVVEVAHHAALDSPEVDQHPDRGPLIGRDRGARQGQVDDAAGELDAIGHGKLGDRLAGGDAAVAAVFRKVKDMTVGEPGELGREAGALWRGW